MEGPIDLMFGPLDYESREFQARCQVRRIVALTGEPNSQVICKAIADYYRQVLQATTDEQLQAERNHWRSIGISMPDCLSSGER